MTLGKAGGFALGFANFGRTRQEDENIASGLFGEDAFQGRRDLTFQGRRGVGKMADLEGKQATFTPDERTRSQVLLNGSGVERGGHDDDAEIGPRGGLEPAQQGECEVGFEVSLVEFIQHYGVDSLEVGVGDEPAREDAFGEEAEARLGAGHFFEPDLIPDGLA